MDSVQELLFGSAPRRVGTPYQSWVFSPGQVGEFIAHNQGRANCYATLGRWDLSEGPINGKVLYDLDSPAKSDRDGQQWELFDDDPAADEVIEWMRSDRSIAEAILGDVLDDARRLAHCSIDDNVPIVGVFSGFGIHIHQLFEPKLCPAAEMVTTANRYIDQLDLQTVDCSILGEPDRICRIPNCERIVRDEGDATGASTGLFTIPLSADELRSLELDWLLEVSTEPRTIEPPDDTERPQLRVWPDYRTERTQSTNVTPRPFNQDELAVDRSGDIREIMADLLRMPCMVQRLCDDPNPDHDVRTNSTVLLLNAGLDPQTIIELYARLNWTDWDREKTTQQVYSIYDGEYSEKHCQTLYRDGLCVYPDNPQECPCHGWESDGTCDWT